MNDRLLNHDDIILPQCRRAFLIVTCDSNTGFFGSLFTMSESVKLDHTGFKKLFKYQIDKKSLKILEKFIDIFLRILNPKLSML